MAAARKRASCQPHEASRALIQATETQGNVIVGQRPAQEPIQSGDDVAQQGVQGEGAGPLMPAVGSGDGDVGARGDIGAKGGKGAGCAGLEDLDASIEGIEEIDVEEALYHLYGFDVMADSDLRVWLLEVNSYPAIASGTMSAGDSRATNKKCFQPLHTSRQKGTSWALTHANMLHALCQKGSA